MTATTESALGPLVRARTRPFAGARSFARSHSLGAVCGGALVVVIGVALFAGALAPFLPEANHAADSFHAPSRTYILGTDSFGRDVFSRIVYGARISIQVAALSVAVSMFVAMALGISAAYVKGPWDYAVGRVVDVAQALPAIVFLILLLTILGRSVTAIGLSLGLLFGIVGSRVVRGATYAVASQQFVEVAKAIGCPPLLIMVRHLVPNVLPMVLVLGSLNVGTAIIAEAALSFIGYGVRPPTPSWGGMLTESRPYMVFAPWLFWAPTVCLATVVFCVNMFGDALRDKLDPRLRGST